MHNYINQPHIQSKIFNINKIITSVFEILTNSHSISELHNLQQRSVSATETFEEGRKSEIFQYYTLNKGTLIPGKM